MAYAQGTSVDFDKSIAEIITLLRRAGAGKIGQFDDLSRYAIQFTLADRTIRFHLPIPSIEDMPQYDGHRRTLTRDQRASRLAQARRQRGRALLLVIKAKLESVESGIETIEQAFLAHVVMPGDQRTIYERIGEHIAIEYRTGKPSSTIGLLPAPGGNHG